MGIASSGEDEKMGKLLAKAVQNLTPKQQGVVVVVQANGSKKSCLKKTEEYKG